MPNLLHPPHEAEEVLAAALLQQESQCIGSHNVLWMNNHTDPDDIPWLPEITADSGTGSDTDTSGTMLSATRMQALSSDARVQVYFL